MELKKIQEIISLFEKSDITVLELEENKKRIRLEKGTTSLTQITTTKEEVSKPAGKEIVINGVEVKSPLVGTFYSASSEGGKPFVSVGDKVNKGDVLCIVEAMKTMNEIRADQTGIVQEVLIENGALVEFGQVLMVLGNLDD